MESEEEERNDSDSGENDDLLLLASQMYEESYKQKKPSRWGSPKTSSDIEGIRKAGIPVKTRKQTEWCLSVWKEWATHRRKLVDDTEDGCHDRNLSIDFTDMTVSAMNYWLCRFVVEARKKDGSNYPPNSVYQLCCGLNRALGQADRGDVKMFEDARFLPFRDTLDSRMKELKGSGQFESRKAEVISVDVENLLWEKNILGDSDPGQLLDTLVFYLGLCFALRSGEEHRRLRHKPSQFQVVEQPSGECYLAYREDVSKSNQGGLKHQRKGSKEVVHYENKAQPQRCVVRLFKMYNSKCPVNRPDGSLYLKPRVKPTEDCWYTTVAVGHNMLSKTVKRLMDQAGIQGHFTNHSLRASAATRLFESGIDEQLIMLRTGHSSVSGVRSYKRVGEKLRVATSNVLNGGVVEELPANVKRCKVAEDDEKFVRGDEKGTADEGDLKLLSDDKENVGENGVVERSSKLVTDEKQISRLMMTSVATAASMPAITFGNATNFTVNFNFQ